MPTKADTHTLTPQQATVCDLLATGTTITDAAEAVKVSRQTVSEWLHHHAVFQATLNARRRELFDEGTERLRSLVPKALDVIAAALDGHSPKAALASAVYVLKAAGVYGRPAPSGSTDAEEIEAREKLRRFDIMLSSV